MIPSDNHFASDASAAPQPLPDIRRTITLNAPIDKAWKAVSTAEGMAAWFMPSNMEAVVGHEFLLEAGPFGQSPCRVTEVEPPNRLSFRWGKDWTLTFELHELEPGKTEFTLIHSGWSADQVTEFGQPHSVVRENMAGGWVGIVAKLAKLLEA
ncbi:SRPBCC family protein [Gorillibacterium timonense]|uniref:SRPBCC family protein n=1 Tax=Gorillibacterium timonense TaxID=1689269 RepID=UPI00071E09E6|nr:SRPBCC domain-containing protein [Gorillibacterium timonense]